MTDTGTETAPIVTAPSRGVRLAGLSGFVFALIQSLCTAVLAVSGIRVAIGLTALAAASGIYAPARGFHQDAIRIPMLVVGAVGALVNLAVLFQIWRLRARASADWRRREQCWVRTTHRQEEGDAGALRRAAVGRRGGEAVLPLSTAVCNLPALTTITSRAGSIK